MATASTTLSTPVLKKAIDRYYKQLQDYKGRAIYELAVRTAFLNLLNEAAHQAKWMPIPVQSIEEVSGKTGCYFIVEVKADYQIDAPVVVAKRTFAEKTAVASNMTYFLLKASDAQKGHYEMIWHPKSREKYLGEVIQERMNPPEV
jgi:hypothetical protein